MYAVVVNVSIAAGQFETTRKAVYDQVVPRAKQAHGFLKGYWTVSADSREGTSMTIFQTKQDAESALAMIRTSTPPAGISFNSTDVREVIAEA